MKKKTFVIRFAIYETVVAENWAVASGIAQERFAHYNPKVFKVDSEILNEKNSDEALKAGKRGQQILFKEDWIKGIGQGFNPKPLEPEKMK